MCRVFVPYRGRRDVYLLQVVHLSGEGLLQDPQDLPALLQREGADGDLRLCISGWRSLTARLFDGCFHDTITAWNQSGGHVQVIITNTK